MDLKHILNTLNPDSELEKRIISDPEFIEGVKWGKKRKGHPEGMVLTHIVEVLENVKKYGDGITRSPLRLITLIHDTFKYKVNRSKARLGDNHHAMIARKFAEKYLENYYFMGHSGKHLLDIIELHDEAYNCYLIYKDGNEYKAKDRLIKLVNRLGNSIPLYKLFYKCDNHTGDKDRGSYEWFVNETKDAPLYHIDRTLDTFQEDIDKIKSFGFNPIGVTQLMLEETFIFETDEEAKLAFETLEGGKKGVVGWWYGKDSFEKAKEDYIRDYLTDKPEYRSNGYATKFKVIWL